ncbi:unnamed protein product, partial [marine sediment metagenome]
MVLLSATSASAVPLMKVLFRTGDPAPDGGVFGSFYGSANVNSSGVVVVGAEVLNPGSVYGSWTSAGGYLRQGDMGPRGLPLTGVYGPSTINSAGTITYYG